MIALEDDHISFESWESIYSFDVEEAERILAELKEIAPFIHWKTRWDEHEILNGQDTI
jgi:hypothetical protein